MIENQAHTCWIHAGKINQQKYLKIMNIWKSYMWTADWRIIWTKIIAAIYATYAVAKRKPEKFLGLYGEIRTLDLCDTGAALYQLS